MKKSQEFSEIINIEKSRLFRVLIYEKILFQTLFISITYDFYEVFLEG
ncbi:unnamed protein product [marine sediment metagenome]|uniref:Uncharacterized protein n=1 Tax=marine sediment metagenome TaxID=412755 RepID=X1RY47_9ZZZZ